MIYLKRFLALLTALCLLLLCGCGEQPPVETAAPTTAPTTIPTVPPKRTAPIHSGIREDGTFDSGTLFIGDSLTNGFIFENLMRYDRIGDARYMAIVGTPVQSYFQGPTLRRELSAIYSGEFNGLTFAQGVERVGSEITAVYFMLGSNYSEYTTYETYNKIVAHLLEHCPNATVYLQTIPYSTSEYVEYEKVNGILEQLALEYAESVDTRVLLIDTHTAFGDRLREDGIHINHEAQEIWYQTLLDFAEENNIPQ